MYFIIGAYFGRSRPNNGGRQHTADELRETDIAMSGDRQLCMEDATSNRNAVNKADCRSIFTDLTHKM